MSPAVISLIIVAAAVIVVLIIFYFLGKKMQRKRDEQQETIESMKQTISMLVIDKKKLPLKASGLPQQMIDQSPWYLRRSKVPVVKAKVGPKIMLFVAENEIFAEIPLKKEVKATVSGLYITGIRGIRGPIEKPVKKRGFFARLMGQK
ncbi:Uncharacterised protein [uncultured Roseburia sp.]|uniref:Uncharacterized protein n=1 Tax=Brotonthovivens ammoniilytica TaxID=2981725 RepID=A0ABT2TLQ7_9FIRM|nr:hypothetical protein [Brotonthovivens ammoniilytica]MCU6763086.1 hypothetical protein [Brotonthovivens ammoniilytica]SCJ02782.1 Uncharacterised protein [uncultured Roseburia sp.]